MGYLNNAVITVDAILTTKGRELLARNDGSFQITQFALGDDEIDYTLYNPNHPSGSAYYGEALDNMPLLEAFPSELQIMKYKLTTLPRGTSKLPVLDLGYAAITLRQGAQLSITPQTLNYLGNEQTFETSGYSATIGDVRVLSTFAAQGIQTGAAISANANATRTIGTSVAKTITGTQINVTATTVNTLFGSNAQLRTTLTVTGLDSGARITIPVTVTRQTLTAIT
jgi:hypothetical protein|tara:strand:- start:424 stop:1101 length:678 start_codon:yes stop_codon:yes gene_type:complete